MARSKAKKRSIALTMTRPSIVSASLITRTKSTFGKASGSLRDFRLGVGPDSDQASHEAHQFDEHVEQ